MKKSEDQMIEELVEEELYNMTEGAIRSYAAEMMQDWYRNQRDWPIEELYERRLGEGKDETE